MKAYFICMLSFLTLSGTLQAQYDANWTLDSMILRFDQNGLVSISPGDCQDGVQLTSISDANGNLQYYTSLGPYFTGFAGNVLDRNHQVILNGSGLNMARTVNGSCFLPYGTEGKLGLVTFSLPSGGIRAWYHIIDTIQNNVIKKNILLNPGNMIMKFGSAPIRHANGRDWWLIMHNIFGREYLVYRCTPDTITLDSIYTLGGYLGSDGNYIGSGAGGGFLVNKMGNIVYHFTLEGLVEELSFNRCTGSLQYKREILPRVNDNSALHYSAELSPNDKYLYLSTDNWTNSSEGLYQYDLGAVDVASTRYTVFGGTVGGNEIVEWIRCAPDGKLYFQTSTTQTVRINSLSVVSNPDVGGSGCGLIHNGLSLNGYSYDFIIFPFFSNYYLGAIPNSLCDTLGLSNQNLIQSPQIELYPNPATDKIHLEWPEGPSYFTLRIFDSTGKLMHQECAQNTGKQSIPLFQYPVGIYMLQVEDESGRRVNRRFAVNY